MLLSTPQKKERKNEKKQHTHRLFGIPDDYYCFDGQFIHTFPCELLFMTGEDRRDRQQVGKFFSFTFRPRTKDETRNQDSHVSVVVVLFFFFFYLPCELDGLLQCSGSL